VAQNVVAIRARCDLVATVGKDSAGAILRETLHRADVGSASLVSVSRCTTQKTRVLARSQQLLRVDEEEDVDLDDEDTTRVLEAVRTAVTDADAVVLEDYNKGVLVPAVIARRSRRRARDRCRSSSTRSSGISSRTAVRRCSSRTGASSRRHSVRPSTSIIPMRSPRRSSGSVSSTSCSRSATADGAFLARRRGGACADVAREVYDVVGAGDTVTAYLATVLAAGGTVLEAAISRTSRPASR
jgi:D-beta-D-heptose 7-phosphate kinase/D-beta-D-heptose 1-phosphate adenosyltransferase